MKTLQVVVVAAALLAACENTLAPAGQRLTPRDQATIRAVLTDPVLEAALGDLADRPAANQLHVRIADIVILTSSAEPARARTAIATLLEDPLWKAFPSRDIGDRLDLEVVALALDQVDDLLAASRFGTERSHGGVGT